MKIICRRLFLLTIVGFSWLAGISVACAIVTTAPRPRLARAVEDTPLMLLGTQKFSSLTSAERALLSDYRVQREP
jgi:hypothetical protein